MEDRATARRARLSHRRPLRRRNRSWSHNNRLGLALAFRSSDALHRLGLFESRLKGSYRRAIMKALYFAWVRERIGKAEEEITPPENIKTVAELMAWLSGQGENYAAAFAHIKSMRAALDRTHVKHGASIQSAREIAFFPPMTGG